MNRKGPGNLFTGRIIKNKLISENDALKIISEQMKTSFVDLKGISIEKAVLEKVPVKIASYYKFLPLRIENRLLPSRFLFLWI